MSDAATPNSAPARPPISRRMGRAALIVAAGVLLSRVLGLVRDRVVAGVLGFGRVMLRTSDSTAVTASGTTTAHG